MALLLHAAHAEAMTEKPIEPAYLAYLADAPRRVNEAASETADEVHAPAWQKVLSTWAQVRQGRTARLADSHLALVRLRLGAPALCAQAEAIHAESVFHLGARWAVVWLDHALDQVERFGQHHVKARLLALKARALEAAGETGEGRRFRHLARQLAERQDARLYLERFIPR